MNFHRKMFKKYIYFKGYVPLIQFFLLIGKINFYTFKIIVKINLFFVLVPLVVKYLQSFEEKVFSMSSCEYVKPFT